MPPVKKIVMWIIVLFLLYAILTNPGSAADVVKATWDIIWTGILNIFEFFNRLLRG